MALEVVTTINTLDPTLPTDTDPMGEGSQHIRNVKAALKATFAFIDGPTKVTDEDLDWLFTNRTALTATLVAALKSDADIAFTHNFASTKSITAQGDIGTGGQFFQGIFPLVPRGIVSLWAGTLDAVPGGWALCDGQNGTPDLRGRFIVGANPILVPGSTGGSQSARYDTSSAGAHNHTQFTGLGGATSFHATLSAAGAHDHGGSTGGHALTVDELPAHHHSTTIPNGTATTSGGTAGYPTGSGTQAIVSSDTGSGVAHTHTITGTGNHTHDLTVDPAAAHNHEIAAEPAHVHSVTVQTLPPFFALAYIIKL